MAGRVTQSPFKPTLKELVCICNFQPRWSAGQLKLRLPPLTVLVRVNALVLTVEIKESTEMLPSTSRLLVQFTPPPDTDMEAPFKTGPLNSLNDCPTASDGPRLLMVTEAPPALVNTPDTTMRSFEGFAEVLTSAATLPASVRSLLIVRVPIEAPAARVPPLFTVTGATRVPVPPSVPLVLTVTAPLPVPLEAPLMSRTPALTVVAPVRRLLSPDKIKVPGPALTMGAELVMGPEKVTGAVLLTVSVLVVPPKLTSPEKVSSLVPLKTVLATPFK